jgi:hypothetical protein
MNAVTAEMVLYAITAVAVVVWVEGLRFMVATVRKGRKGFEQFANPNDAPPANIICGSAEVDGNTAELSQRAATLLAAKSVLICERTDESIVFETPKEIIPGQNINIPSLHGQLRFTPLEAQKTRVDYAITRPHVRALLILGFSFTAMGFVAIVAGFLLIYFLVIPSPFEAVRWQTVQMLNVTLFLWPPFLLGGLYRKSASLVKAQFDTFIHNLPFVKL